jgi:hypothetical protein
MQRPLPSVAAAAALPPRKAPFPKRLVQVLLIVVLLIISVIGLAVGISSASPSSRSRRGGPHLTRGQQLLVGGIIAAGIAAVMLCAFECSLRCHRRRQRRSEEGTAAARIQAGSPATPTESNEDEDLSHRALAQGGRRHGDGRRRARCCSAPPMLRDAAAEARHLAARWNCLRSGCEYSHVWDGCLGIVGALILLALFLFVEALEEGYKV